MLAFLSGYELVLVLVVVLLIFGGAKLPQLARSLGQAQKEFKQGLNEGASSDDEPTRSDEPSS